MADKKGREAGLLYWIVRGILRFVLFIFFRDIQIINRDEYVSKEEGPIIFVGNHQNQFVDPAMLITNIDRPISFLIAEKSMRRPLVGFLAQSVNSIPVKRAQDEAIKGEGKVTASGSVVTGHGTHFKTSVQVGQSILIGKQEEPPVITEIIDDTTIKVSPAYTEDVKTPTDYKIWKKIDQAGVYESVWTALNNGSSIGIFPEGGSHDRSELLPLKAGVTIMALGAVAKYGTKVKIVPCGLNYLRGHKFRSQVIVEFGKPIEISPELVEKYKVNKREACTDLLEMIRVGLRSVTINCSDYNTLSTILMARRLYQPTGLELTPDQYLALNRKFVDGYLTLAAKGEPALLALKDKVEQYNNQLNVYGIADHQVMTLPPPNWVDKLSMAFGRAVFLLIIALLGLPGFIINIPATLFVKQKALAEAKKAKESSTVKIAGLDVIASYKILTAMVVLPTMHVFWGILFSIIWGPAWGLLCFFFINPVLSYASMRLVEVGFGLWAESKPLFISLLYGGDDYRLHLQKSRNKLAKQVQHTVEELGPKIFGDAFEKNRIITHEDLEEYSTPTHKSRILRSSYKKVPRDD